MAKKKKIIAKLNTDKQKIPNEESSNEFITEQGKSKKDKEAKKKASEELGKIRDNILKLAENKDKKLSKEEKIKILQDYAIKQIKDNTILQEELKKAREEYLENRGSERKTANRNKTAIDKAKAQIRKVVVAYVEYYDDPNSRVYSWYELTKLSSILINPKRGELFLMEKPAKFLNGKRVFILFKGIPFSIPMEFFMDDLYEKMENMPNLPKDEKGKPIFGRAHLSSQDCYAKYTSIKTIMLFGIKRSVLYTFGLLLFSFVLGMMTLYIVLSPYLFTK